MSEPASRADCLSDSLAAGYVDDILDAPERARVDAHLAGCPSCRWLVATLAHRSPAAATVPGAAGPEVPREPTASLAPTGPAQLPPPPSPELAIGTLLGRYQIVRRVGAGGMGTVYAAHDPMLRREVAIKLLLVDGRRRTEAQARLLREAHAMARLSHPAVVPIHDVGTHAGGVFLAMELIDGQDARRWLSTAKPGWKQALATLLPVGRGLAAAHAAGIVHRDVKPANVLVGRDGRARITDFGLARTDPRDDDSASSNGWRADSAPAFRRVQSGTDPDPGRRLAPDPALTVTSEHEDEASGGVSSDAYLAPATDAPLTRDGTILGTPMYMAPEQHEARRASARSDQFSFCVLLYEAVYGERPFAVPPDAPHAAVALAGEVLAGRVRAAPAGSQVPGWLRRILLRGLAPRAADRWPSMDALVDAIEAAPRQRRRPLLYAGALAVAVGLGGAFTVGRSAHGDETCSDGDRQLATAWPTADRAAAWTRLAGLGSYGAATAPRLEAQVGDFAARWAAGHRDACLAHRRGALSDPLYDRRVACLGRGRAALGAVAELVRSADSAKVPGTVLAVRALPDPAACADLDALVADPTAPPPALAARAAAVEATLERARVDIAGGEYRAGRDVASRAVTDARAIGHPPLLAEALLVEGQAAMSVDRAAAVPVLAEATSAALSSGADAIAVEAWARRAWLDGYAGRMAEAGDGRAVMESLSARPTAAGFARALFHNNVGTVDLAAGAREHARTEFERAVDESRTAGGAQAVELVNARGNLALATDDPDRREAIFTDAEQALTRLVGADHPLTLQQRRIHAQWMLGMARTRDLLAKTCAIYERFDDAESASLVICHTELGTLSDDLGDRPAALASMKRATEIQRLHPGGPLIAAGYVALWTGDLRGAQEWFETAISRLPREPKELWRRTFGRADLQLGLARALRAGDDLARARTLLEQTITDLLTVHEAIPAPPVERLLAQARSELVAVLRATGGPPDQIRQLAGLAAAWLRVDGGRPDQVAELERLAAGTAR